MKINYAKTILYAYANIESVIEQIDELVEKSALSSMCDFRPAMEQYQKILAFTEQKDVLIELKIVADGVLEKFSSYELECMDYKYFKRVDRAYYNNFDAVSRAYFRAQIKIAEKFARRMEYAGIDDLWFENKCLKIDFFRELLKLVKEREKKLAKKKTPECAKTFKKTAVRRYFDDSANFREMFRDSI